MPWTLVRSTTSYTSGGYYFEVTINNVVGGVMIGLVAGLTSTTGYPGDAGVGGNGYGNDRNFYANGVVTGANAAALAAIAEGDIIGFTVDFDANTYRVRNVTESEAWSVAQALHATIDEESCYVAIALLSVDDSATINFTPPFRGEPPTDPWEPPAEVLPLSLPPKPPPPNVLLTADGQPTKHFHDYLTLQYEWERRIYAVLTEG